MVKINVRSFIWYRAELNIDDVKTFLLNPQYISKNNINIINFADN